MLENAPIRRKLMAILLLVSATVMLVTCGGFCTYEIITFRKQTAERLLTLGDIIAANSTAALAFDNPDDAREVLTALRAERHIEEAGLYDKNGKLFATYPETLDTATFPAKPQADGYRFEGAHLVCFLPVIQSGKRMGTLYLQSDLGVIAERFRSYGEIALAVIVVSFLFGYLLAQKLQQQISAPILELAETAKGISERRDYSVRAKGGKGGEFGLLRGAFNQMLDQIQAQLSRLDLLSRTTRAIGERQDLASICQVVVGNLEDHLSVDFGCVCIYDASRQTLKVMSVGSKSMSLANTLDISSGSVIEAGEKGLARCVRGHLVYEPDLTTVPTAFTQRLAAGGLRALVVAPLAVESSIFGVLIAARRERESFDSGECEFLRQLSEHTALAAHQAQLYNALQQAYDDLRQSQQTVMEQERLRALGQMASGIAHDINNAISPIGLYTESLLENEPGLSARARDYLGTIQHAIEDVAQTVSRMKEFYRRREQQLNLSPVHLNQLFQQVIDLSRARWSDMPQQRGCTVSLGTEFDPNLGVVMGVESEIREALINLIFNAVDAMPQGGKLTLRTRMSGGSVLAEVSDTGIGMDEETRRRCLEPFFTTKGERGTGLGLAMVYGTAKRHNAEVQIDSEAGHGTTMRLVFPEATEPPPDTGSKVEAARPTPTRARILLVDDDPILIKSLRDTLEGDGHAVTPTTGGQAGIDTFTASSAAGKPFDVVITDLGMPNVDGRKVARAIKKVSPETPVILLTGWGQRLMAEGDAPEEVNRVLSKPPKLRELREALSDCLSARET